MQRRNRLLFLTFIESFGTICVERGIFFFAYRHLGFGEAANLWLSLAFGVPYVVGALASHRVAARFGERRTLHAALGAQVIVHLLLAALGRMPGWLFVLNGLIGLLNGLKWPVVESYVSAGLDADTSARMIGRFNMSWSSSVPLALACTGPFNTLWPGGLFLVPAGVNLVALAIASTFQLRPEHLPEAHPSRPPAKQLAEMTRLLGAGRCFLALSYSLMWMLSAMLPAILARADVGDRVSPALSGVMDVFRVVAFVVLWRWLGWVGSRRFLLAAGAALPAGFFLVATGNGLVPILAGELVFGLGLGAVYCASIYYALVVKNAAVDAGGYHEALIGVGFTLGPCVGLFGLTVAPYLGGRTPGMLLAAGPMVLIATVSAIRRGRGQPLE